MFGKMLDAAKSAIYETPVDPNADNTKTATPTGSGIGISSHSASLPQMQGVNPDMVAAIKKVTFGRNTAFTQLLQAAESLADVIPDATMRLKAAHKTAGAGRSGQQIADAVDVHLQDVDGEEMRFKAAIDAKAVAEIGTIEAQAQVASQQIAQAQAEIQQAQERIGALTVQIGQLTTTAATAQAQVVQKRGELDAAQAQFKLSAQSVRNELSANKAAILSTLS